ncbi:hypothetical protein [Defluviicoccus vanus]|uniref:hypothetical protein n=1 Tax=Defluviicoccus vanus TaxID=111831 RepID=UPI001CBA64C2|nr:hypothetical protein [Defluviicoccus vanus]
MPAPFLRRAPSPSAAASPAAATSPPIAASPSISSQRGTAGTATTVARADHSHAAATTTVDGLLAAADKQKLDSVATGAQVNPAAATDAEITAGTATATRTVSPAQIKAAVTTFVPVPSVAGRTGAVTLTQADVAGTVPSARAITVGSGLTGGGDLSADRSIAVNLATAGELQAPPPPSPAPTTATQQPRPRLMAFSLPPTSRSSTASPPEPRSIRQRRPTRKSPPAPPLPPVPSHRHRLRLPSPPHSPVITVAGRTGAITLSLADASDSLASTGRYAVTTNETNLLRAFPEATFAGRQNGMGSGALTTVLPSEAVAMLPLATAASDGIMPAAAKAKLDAIAAFPECNLGTFSTGNSAIILQDMAATVVNPGLANSAILGVSLKNTPLIYLRGTVGTAGASTARIAVMFSPNAAGPYTWYMADGTLAPANGSAAPVEPNGYCAADISNGGSATFRTAITVPPAIQALDSCSLQLIRWGGDGVADPSLINLRVSAIGTLVSPTIASVFGRAGAIVAASGDYAANQILDASDGSKVIMTSDEREIARKAAITARSPYAFFRNRLRFNLTTDFGVNNLVADATPTGSSGTDDRAKLKAIRDYFRANYAGQEFDLLMPADRVAAISKTLPWDIDGAHFIGLGSPAATGFIGTLATYKHWNNSPFLCCSITNSNLSTRQNWRLASGVDGTADMKAGDDAFVASVTTDYDAISVGDKLTILSGRYDTQADPVPTRRFTAKVVSKGSAGRIYLDRKLPFDFPSTPHPAKNSGAYNYKRANGTAVAGNAFAIHREMAADGTQNYVDSVANEYHSKVSFINLLIAVRAGFPTAGFPMDGLYQNCRIVGDGYGLYGNALQNTLVDGCEFETRAGICELGIGSCLNIIRNCTWTRSETFTSEMGQAWLLRDGEYGCYNTFDNIELRGDNLTRTDLADLAVIQALGTTGDKFRNIWARVAVPSTMRAFYVTDYSDQPYGGCHNEFRNIYVESTATGATHSNSVIRFLGSGNSARQVKVVSGSGSVFSNGPQIYAGSDDCDIMDFVVNPQQGNLPLSIQGGCNRTRVTRYDGTVSNNGTGSILTNNAVGSARPGRYF